MSTIALSNYCSDRLFGSGCNDSSCSLQHDVRICEICVVVCSPASNFDAHERGQRHRANLANASLANPRNGKLRRCAVCAMNVHPDEWTRHFATDGHRKHLELASLRAAYEQTEFDKQGVTVSHAQPAGVDFGHVTLERAASGVDVEVTVSTDQSEPVAVIDTQVRSRVPNHATLFSPIAVETDNFTIIRGRPLRYRIRFGHTELGRYEGRLEFTFQGKGQPFVIVRPLLITVVGEANDREILKPVAPYTPARRARFTENLPVKSGFGPPKKRTKWSRELLEFLIPSPLHDILTSGSPKEVSARLGEEYFPEPLSLQNHRAYFQNLLWIEEHRTINDLRMYDMSDVEFLKQDNLYVLRVHGLSEKRPSVVVGDNILVQESQGQHTFKGVVHRVQSEQVYVHFHSTFQAIGKRYNVFFQLNRTTLRRQHQALLATIPDPERILFPDLDHAGLQSPISREDVRLGFFNSSIGTNDRQSQAVQSILQVRPGSAPFIIFGPPGTGKTVTIVEAIFQILHHSPRSKVLVCAPSNSAADIVALLLLTLPTDEMFRCNATFRDPGTVPPELVPYSFRDGNIYSIPPLDKLTQFRVVVSTCINASFAYNAGVPEGHWSHIFVDEAGQASEPEVLTAIKPLATQNTRIILSGDPKQLGPVIRSSTAREFGMDKSFLERLLERPVYSSEQGRGTAYIKLTQNYRSHRAILNFPNEKFYDNELQVCGPENVIDSFLDSKHLVSPRFPVVFHAMSGTNEREASSPSFFNVDEAVQVKSYVSKLLKDRRYPITAREIGVIAPYHAQVRKIRRLLLKANLADVKVGSVEEFQGQERRVIIVSTVRSSTDLLAYDAKFTLGFLSNPRRFNVAVTRAKALLIVIGDAPILSVDPLWRGFMNYVHTHNGWRGDEPTWDVNASVQDDEDYADELREAIMAEMSAAIMLLGPGEDMEAEANVERALDWDEGPATEAVIGEVTDAGQNEANCWEEPPPAEW